MGTMSLETFKKLGEQVSSIDPEFLQENDVLVLWGGEDISSHFYGEKPTYTYAGSPSRRDVIEQRMFNSAVSKGLPIIGVCRGAQLACALSGGRLYQDIQHPGMHYMTCNDGKQRVSNSVHHQMMRPDDTDHQLIAWTNNLSPYHKTEEGDVGEVEQEPEIVYFNKTKALAIQGHPEFVPNGHPFHTYACELIDAYSIR